MFKQLLAFVNQLTFIGTCDLGRNETARGVNTQEFFSKKKKELPHSPIRDVQKGFDLEVIRRHHLNYNLRWIITDQRSSIFVGHVSQVGAKTVYLKIVSGKSFMNKKFS